MNFFARLIQSIAAPLQESRNGSADETRTPAALASWLGGANEDAGKLSDPYNTSPWVSRAIKHISGPIAQVPLKFYLDDQEVEDAERDAFWQRPAKGCGIGQRLSLFDTI